MNHVLAIARALSDENRVSTLLVLGDREICVCQLIELLQLAPSTVSKHMSVLKQAKLVDGRKKGRWVSYRLPEKSAPVIVHQAIAWARKATSGDKRVLGDAEQMKKFLGTNRGIICERQSIRRMR